MVRYNFVGGSWVTRISTLSKEVCFISECSVLWFSIFFLEFIDMVTISIFKKIRFIGISQEYQFDNVIDSNFSMTWNYTWNIFMTFFRIFYNFYLFDMDLWPISKKKIIRYLLYIRSLLHFKYIFMLLYSVLFSDRLRS